MTRSFLVLLFLTRSVLLLGQQLNLFPNLVLQGDPYINAIAQTSDGGYLLSTQVDHVNGSLCGNLVKVDASGNLVGAFNRILVDNNIQTTYGLSNGKILVGGAFQNINGVSASLVRLNADGTLDNSFQSFVVNTYEYVSQLAVQPDGKILVVGSFSQSGYNSLIRLNADGTVDPTLVVFTPPLGYISTIALDVNQNIFLSDEQSVFKLDNNGNPLPGFPIISDGYFSCLVTNGTQVVIAGNFNFVGSTARSNLAIVNADGSLAPYVINGLNDVSGVAVTTTGDVIINDLNRAYVYDGNGTAIDTLASTLTQQVLIDASNRIIVGGGSGMQALGSPHAFMARFNPDFTLDPSFVCKASYTGGIVAMASHPDGRIVAGADASLGKINGDTSRLVRINLDGSLDNTFHFNGSTIHGIQSVAVQPDNKILVCSDSLTRLNESGARDHTFQFKLGAQDTVGLLSKIVWLDSSLFLCGQFDRINGFHSPGIIKLNEDGTTDTSFKSGLPDDAYVADFAFQSSGKIVVVGGFLLSTTELAVARLNTSGSLDGSFTNGSISTNGIDHVRADSLDRIYLSGSFLDYNGSPQNPFIRLTAQGNPDTSFSPALPFPSTAIDLEVSEEVLGNQKIFLATTLQYGQPALGECDDQGNAITSGVTNIGENSSIASTYFDGFTLYVSGRIASADQSQVSGLAYTNIYPVYGSIANLVATRTGLTTAHLTWTNAIHKASLMILERSAETDLAFMPIDSLAPGSVSFDDPGISANSGYYYRIKAINTSSTTPYFPEVYIGPEQPQTGAGTVGVFPNPVDGYLTIALPSVDPTQISLYCIDGRWMGTWKSSEDIVKLDFTLLSQGMYVLRVTLNQSVVTCKIVKK